jgi:hypothetical protein
MVEEHIYVYFAMGFLRGALIMESQMFQKIFWRANEQGSLKRKKKLRAHPRTNYYDKILRKNINLNPIQWHTNL